MGAINTLGSQKDKIQGPAGLNKRDLRGSDIHPQNEDYWGNVNTLGPRACYDEGKRCAETLFMNYHSRITSG